MDMRSTERLGWTNKQIRDAVELTDFQIEILSKGRFAETADNLRIKLSHIDGVVKTFTATGEVIEEESGWGDNTAAEIGVLKTAQALFDRWAADSADLLKHFS